MKLKVILLMLLCGASVHTSMVEASSSASEQEFNWQLKGELSCINGVVTKPYGLTLLTGYLAATSCKNCNVRKVQLKDKDTEAYWSSNERPSWEQGFKKECAIKRVASSDKSKAVYDAEQFTIGYTFNVLCDLDSKEAELKFKELKEKYEKAIKLEIAEKLAADKK